MDRREFIEKSIIGGTAMTIAGTFGCGEKKSQEQKEIPKRRLGRADDMLSVIGFGGILVKDEEQKKANDMVAEACDCGINYFDVAPTYGDAQDRLGPALKPYRDKCFLACKTTQRKKQGAEKELHESLQKLQTDHLDLYQLHAITTIEDVETVFAPGGAFEVFLKAKKDGKVRYLGFSAHSEEAALLAMEKYDFDTILFPINFVCWHHGKFGARVVEKAKETNKGILALKSLAFTKINRGEERPFKKCWYKPIPIENDDLLNLAVRFTLSQGTTAAIPPGEPLYFPKALNAAVNFSPITDEENANLQKIAQSVEPIFKV